VSDVPTPTAEEIMQHGESERERMRNLFAAKVAVEEEASFNAFKSFDH
jgi:hypothetical protein